MHIAFIEHGSTRGYQLRRGSGGKGRTRFFASRKHGGDAGALLAAELLRQEWARELPDDSRQARRGQLIASNTSGISGIRFEWDTFSAGEPYLHVKVSYTDLRGRARATGYSCERNGLDGALDLAIDIRVRHGVTITKAERARALRNLRAVYASGPA